MSWSVFVVALGIMFVFEAILPLGSPPTWRRLMQYLCTQTDKQLQITGLASMVLGLCLVLLAQLFY